MVSSRVRRSRLDGLCKASTTGTCRLFSRKNLESTKEPLSCFSQAGGGNYRGQIRHSTTLTDLFAWKERKGGGRVARETLPAVGAWESACLSVIFMGGFLYRCHTQASVASCVTASHTDAFVPFNRFLELAVAEREVQAEDLPASAFSPLHRDERRDQQWSDAPAMM